MMAFSTLSFAALRAGRIAARTPTRAASSRKIPMRSHGDEGVSLQGGHGDHRQRQHPREQLVDGDYAVLVLVGVGEQPVHVEPVGVRGGGDTGS
ncbi:hypothetical protein SGLAU_32230 [Streptomyces glaucescens]|uniref:Uncharacterized protein n=1 Tax=Streptomyces glaucescens TaxID=1907 RepID=A0A089XMG2_STRGA|nr:hypothetical protein SGLAU_32230 [Streptomyces glaucescens]